MSTADDEKCTDTSTPSTPQEWKWFLQGKGLIPDKEEYQSSASIKKLESKVLPPTAVITQRTLCRNTPIKERVSQGLLWLHQASCYDLPLLEKALAEKQTQWNVLDNRGRALVAPSVDCVQEISDLLPITEDSKGDFQEKQVQKIISLHVDLLRDAIAHYQEICTRAKQPAENTGTLERALSSSNGTTVDFAALRMELEELLAFYQSRIRECSGSIPAFMMLVSSDNVETLTKYQDCLQQVLKELKNQKDYDNKVKPIKMRLAETGNEHLNALHKMMEATKTEIEQVELDSSALENDVAWCQDRIEWAKTSLEQDIDELLYDKNEESSMTRIEIVV